jgi:hypothetical protein
MNEQKLNNLKAANEAEFKGEAVVTTTVEPTVETIASLFASNDQGSVFSGNNQLNKTARLTQMSTDIANEVFKKVVSSGLEYEAAVKASQQSHDAMDDLINECFDLGSVNIDFLKTVSEDELEKMVRSQQSKRSRSKSKAMTQDNYITMMIGAVAENLLRLALGKPKSAGGGAVMGEIGFSAEDLEKLADFPEDLKKAIRNVQSKKSIMKAKANFDVQSPRWQQLLRAEQQLKEVRDRTNGLVNEQAEQALKVKEQAEEMLADINVDELDANDAKALLEAMKEMLANK